MDRSVESMLADIEPVNQGPAQAFWADLCAYIPSAAGSTKSHQAWEEGYRHHIQEVMNLAYKLYPVLDSERKLPFSLASALLVLFLHDCEKPFRHATDGQLSHFPWVKQRPIRSDKDFQAALIRQYRFVIGEAELNGLKYVEGENEDYVEGRKTQGPLAAFCHICDVISARIWFDHPAH